MLFNVNHEVRVKLTDYGLRCMEQAHERLNQIVPLGPFRPKPADEEGWTKFQLWDLMSELGPHIALGRPVPFETTIDILAAQGIEAQRAETTGSVHESPVPEGNAPTPSQSDNQQEDK